MNDRAPRAFDATLLHRLEEASLNASAPPQQLLIDGWLVRFCPGKAKRARSVNAISAGRLLVADKLALCQRVYDEAELPLFIRITPFSEPSGLDAQLEAHGLRKLDDTRVMVCADPARHIGGGLPPDMSLQRVGLDAFAQTVGALRGSSLAQRQAHAQRLANSPVPFFAALLKRGGEVVGCGQVAIEGDMVGLYDIFTAPAARGRGVAGVLCRQLLADALSRGAKTAYLQVDAANAPARALYHRMGFIDAYAYHYRTTHPTAA
ncbi:GNAT family N-acetyltransferase [Piscinibacter terrae]|uniref:GNAT family N-acetyltransferase n=1 Tax=Piscinibacter terrae TaxID=2496871 RepID=A0A3N7HQ11_9BURK|nr:GNAT family N-acetyltransferase [Albitalea terrae]RQP24280.1 GNAT family N-acetyltransferase [Albitalea terrae]